MREDLAARIGLTESRVQVCKLIESLTLNRFPSSIYSDITVQVLISESNRLSLIFFVRRPVHLCAQACVY